MLGKWPEGTWHPLTTTAVKVLTAWLKKPARGTDMSLFPSLSGGRLSADVGQDLVAKHVAIARLKCPALVRKRVTPHVLRHTAAMELMQAGVDRSMIAVWLGTNLSAPHRSTSVPIWR